MSNQEAQNSSNSQPIEQSVNNSQNVHQVGGNYTVATTHNDNKQVKFLIPAVIAFGATAFAVAFGTGIFENITPSSPAPLEQQAEL